MNGVVTYAREGTVKEADAFCLSPELNKQGRCVATNHGAFWIWNVYVPASNLSRKMQFLDALREALKQKRESTGQAQILVGDLNISHSVLDVHWKDRWVHIQDVLDEVKASGAKSELAEWKLDMARHWGNVAKAMGELEAVPTKTTNTHTGEKFDKYRLRVKALDGKTVCLGKHETSSEHCLYCYDLKAQSYFDLRTKEQRPSCEANVLRVGVLGEIMNKIAGATWDETVLRDIANTMGSTPRQSPHRRWLSSLLQEDDMVDVFRHYYPCAEARFTCWHQFTNQRYVNNGVRLDYTIIDKSLLQYAEKGQVDSLRCFGAASEDDPLGESAALKAVTANGSYEPVSFEGGGMKTEVPQAVLDSQFGAVHTGMLYTPPQFSDHIGVSLLLSDEVVSGHWPLVLQENGTSTRKAQPHKKQMSISSFFQQPAKRSVKSQSTSSLTKKMKITSSKKPPPSSILHHFATK